MPPSRTPPGPDRGRAAEPDRPGPSQPDAGPEAAAGDALPAARGAAPQVADLLVQWRRSDAAVGPRVTEFPDEAASAVLVAVLDAVRPERAAGAAVGPPAEPHPGLRAAGERWAAAHRSVSELVDRLSLLRALVADLGLAERRAVDRAIDEVTAAAGAGLVAQLEHLSRTDPLTGVGNRRAFDEAVQRALATAARQGHEVTMVVVDLDGLKRINDSRGHAAGDAAIGSLVRAFAAALRGTDTVYRVGGDEFVVLLPYSAADQVEQLMARVASAGAPAFTWGAASFPGDVADAGLLFDRADRALYDRRTAQRAGGPLAAARRPLRVPGALGQVVPIRRWAWVPAAAVVAGAVSLGLVLAGGGRPQPTTSALPPAASAPGRPSGSAPPPVTRPGGGSSGSPGRSSGAGTAPVAPGPSRPATGTPPPAGRGPSVVVSITGPPAGPPGPTGPTTGPTGPGTGPTHPTPPPTGPAPSTSSGSGPVGDLVAGVGQAVSGVPVVDDLITPGPDGSTTVLGLVTLSGGAAAPTAPVPVTAGGAATGAAEPVAADAAAAVPPAPSPGAGALAALAHGSGAAIP